MRLLIPFFSILAFVSLSNFAYSNDEIFLCEIEARKFVKGFEKDTSYAPEKITGAVVVDYDNDTAKVKIGGKTSLSSKFKFVSSNIIEIEDKVDDSQVNRGYFNAKTGELFMYFLYDNEGKLIIAGDCR